MALRASLILSMQQVDGAMETKVAGLALDAQALSVLMPMHVHVLADGRIAGLGDTLSRILGDKSLIGKDFFRVFTLNRPRKVSSMPELRGCFGRKLGLAVVADPDVSFRAVATGGGRGDVILNLSFGIGIVDAVRHHALSQTDFAPTDLTIELLYLVEAKAAVTEELRRLTGRLDGARHVAELAAMTDALTGLRNRRALFANLDAMILQRRSFAVMHLDLDHFKAVNDGQGHAAGDHVLREVARILMAETRQADTVARLGGDEFVVLLPDLVDPMVMHAIGQRIVERIRVPIPFEDGLCQIGASIGISFSTLFDVIGADAILDDADQALYGAKRAGRGQVHLSSR